jgi:hypothetical protein
MPPENIYACTAPGADFPEYVSLNRSDAGMTVSVRSPKKADGSPGDTAMATLDREQAKALAHALRIHLTPTTEA